MELNLQPQLENELVLLRPLNETDFELLYGIASDPLIWEQHPNKDRYKREVFENFFNGALASKGAFVIYDKSTGEAIGSSRYYDPAHDRKTVSIGYTFFARHCWGSTFNCAVKNLMLKHAFTVMHEVHFHIGAGNIRSQKAIEKLGAVKISEQDIAYYGEKNTLNFIYSISKSDWLQRNT